MICSVRIITCTNTGWNAPESFAQLIRTSCAQWRAHYILSNDIEIPDAYIYNTPKNLYRAETSIVVHASVSGETHLSTVNVYIKRTNEQTTSCNFYILQSDFHRMQTQTNSSSDWSPGLYYAGNLCLMQQQHDDGAL